MKKIIFFILIKVAYEYLDTKVIIHTDCDEYTETYNKDAILAGIMLLFFTTIRHTLKHDMGIRTPYVGVNIALNYFFILCRIVLFIAVTFWLIPTIFTITEDSINFEGNRAFDSI